MKQSINHKGVVDRRKQENLRDYTFVKVQGKILYWRLTLYTQSCYGAQKSGQEKRQNAFVEET